MALRGSRSSADARPSNVGTRLRQSTAQRSAADFWRSPGDYRLLGSGLSCQRVCRAVIIVNVPTYVCSQPLVSLVRTEMSQADADKLLDQARTGDRDALQWLLCDHFDRLQQHVEFRVSSGSSELSADDILQDTFVHAVRDIGDCQAKTQVTFFAWLKGVADNRLRDALKKAATKKRGGDRQQVRAVKLVDASSLRPLVELLGESVDTPSVDAASDEAIKAMQVAISSLPEEQRTAIVLRHIQGFDLDDVASQLEKTPAAVRGLIHRGKQALHEALGNSSRWFSKK